MYKANDDRIILENLNKELTEKKNNFEADLEEKLRAKEDELIELRNKLTEIETVLEEKDQNIKNLEEQLIGNVDLIAKLKEEEEKEEAAERLKKTDEKAEEKTEIKKEPKINIEDYILKSIHDELLDEKHEEINTLINTVNVLKRDKEDLEIKISNMKSSVQEITDRLEFEMDKHSNNIEDKSELVQR
jgi:glycerophosphoryl diester phosphodiesterase